MESCCGKRLAGCVPKLTQSRMNGSKVPCFNGPTVFFGCYLNKKVSGFFDGLVGVVRSPGIWTEGLFVWIKVFVS